MRTKPKPTEQEQSIRLNKFIADAGVASRRKADEMIADGRVKVDGKTVTELGTKIIKANLVTVDGDPITHVQHFKYIIINKPKDTITSSKDEFGRKTVIELVRSRARLFTVGRLDRNTTGALLITNDGDLAHRLTHPAYQIERTYKVGLDKEMKLEDIKKLAHGVELEDGIAEPVELAVMPDDRSVAYITLREGRNREVRRMFETLGYEVRKLDRKSFAGITVSGLARGEYRHLTRSEIIALKKLVKLQ